MKMLYILNVAKRVNNFSYTSMLAAQECGYDFHIAGNWSYKTKDELLEDEKKYGIHIHQIDFVRKPYSLKNRTAYRQLLTLCLKEQFDVIHCNTPIGGLLGRIVGHKCGIKTIIYQAHGFHFFKGASVINWLIYYPIEKWLARKTDILITINREDYELAQKKMHLKRGGKIEYVPGVGIDVQKYYSSEKRDKTIRNELGLQDDCFIILATGDLIKRKNYSLGIRIVKELRQNNVHFLICGNGPEETRLKNYGSKLGVLEKIHFLGYRNDIQFLLHEVDMFLMTSKQEGLSRSLMEAMASGLPCVASNIRGNTDLMTPNNGFQYLCDNSDVKKYVHAIELLLDNKDKRVSNAQICKSNIELFSNEIVIGQLVNIYKSII